MCGCTGAGGAPAQSLNVVSPRGTLWATASNPAASSAAGPSITPVPGVIASEVPLGPNSQTGLTIAVTVIATLVAVRAKIL